MPRKHPAHPLVACVVVIGLCHGSRARADVVILGSPPAENDQSLEDAARAVRENRDDDAQALVSRAAAAHPDWPPAPLLLAGLHFAADQPTKGRRAVERAAALAPNDPRVYLTLGSLALNDGRFSDARLNGQKALALLDSFKLDSSTTHRARVEAHASLATVAEATGDWTTARNQLRALTDLDPSNARGRHRLGRSLFHLDRPDDALRQWTRASQDDPSLGTATLNMAWLYGQTGRPEDAEKWFAKAAAEAPANASPRLARARFRLDSGRASEAMPLIEEAAALDPISREVQALRGLACLYRHEWPEAEQLFQALQRAAPEDPEVAAALVLATVEQDDPAKRRRGLGFAESLARKFPNSPDILAALGRAYALCGQPEAAEPPLRTALAGGRPTTRATTAYFLARILAERGQSPKARILLKAAVAEPTAFPYRDDARELLGKLEATPSPRP